MITKGEQAIRDKYYGHSSLCNRFRDSKFPKRGKVYWIPYYNPYRKCTCHVENEKIKELLKEAE